MSKLHYVRFKAEHLEQIEAKDIFENVDAIKAKFKAVEGHPNAFIYTIYSDLGPIAIAGLFVSWPGVAELFSLTSEKVKLNPISFHKTVLHLISVHESALDLHRLQMTVKEDYLDGQKWAESLGFQCEGLLRKYSPDQTNHMMYSKVKNV